MRMRLIMGVVGGFLIGLGARGCIPSAEAQPYFRERDGGVTKWDAGRPKEERGWPNPNGDNRAWEYPEVQP